ncbi:MAG: transporter substrate-binding domain-containing protein [Pseudomonadales bacterium]|nr:transporter substrate-binding domain-containing protein [Pseudomonadales bacterium]
MHFKQVWAGALFVLICQFVAGVSMATEPQRVEVLRISTGDFSPWTDKAAPHSGFVNRVIKEAFRREGYEVQFLYWPWKRALETARVGKVDATSFWYVSEEKVKDFIYSDPISEHKEVFFYLKKNPMKEWNQLTDLVGLKVGATRSFSYTDEFWALAKDGRLNVLEANSDELNFKKLIAGRTDLFPAAEVVGWQALAKLEAQPREVLSTLQKPLAEQKGHLLFPKKSARSMALSEAFNRALKAMREDGTFEQYRAELMAGQY